MAVGAIRGDGAVLGALAADIGGVVCVKVQQKPAPAQHPEPLTVGLFRVRQGPGQVSAEDHIEAALREVRLLGVHLPEVDGKPCLCCLCPALLQHGGGQVNACDPVAHPGKENGKKARAGAHVQNVQRFPFWKPLLQLFQPAAAHIALQLIFSDGPKVVGPDRPVVFDPFFNFQFSFLPGCI